VTRTCEGLSEWWMTQGFVLEVVIKGEFWEESVGIWLFGGGISVMMNKGKQKWSIWKGTTHTIKDKNRSI
jgi:hypothetical protein